MANKYPKTRKATAVVKCPHCDHTGSARGLYQHVRLSHNGITAKPPTSTRIVAHPLDVKGLGHIKEKIHRLDKRKQADWVDLIVIHLAIGIFNKIMENLNNNDLQSEFINSSAIGSVEPKAKRKHYGE